MTGSRANAVEQGIIKCLQILKRMKEIIVTCFTFDIDTSVLHTYENPAKIIRSRKKMFPSKKGDKTDYKKALEKAIQMINGNTAHPDYLSCVIFMSDGDGEYPKDSMNKLIEMKKSGKPLIFMTLACCTMEDFSMLEMSKAIEGEHYNIADATAMTNAFLGVIAT